MMLGLLERVFEEVLNLHYLLEHIWNLESLYILDNSGHLVIFAEIDQLLLSGQGRRPVGRVSFSAECDIRQVQAQKRYSWGTVSRKRDRYSL